MGARARGAARGRGVRRLEPLHHEDRLARRPQRGPGREPPPTTASAAPRRRRSASSSTWTRAGPPGRRAPGRPRPSRVVVVMGVSGMRQDAPWERRSPRSSAGNSSRATPFIRRPTSRRCPRASRWTTPTAPPGSPPSARRSRPATRRARGSSSACSALREAYRAALAAGPGAAPLRPPARRLRRSSRDRMDAPQGPLHEGEPARSQFEALEEPLDALCPRRAPSRPRY